MTPLLPVDRCLGDWIYNSWSIVISQFWYLRYQHDQSQLPGTLIRHKDQNYPFATWFFQRSL